MEHRAIKGASNYTISKDGRVYSKLRHRHLKGGDNAGYKMQLIRLDNGEAKRLYIHRLVCEAWHPNPERKAWVNHKDGNKANNHADNLEWSTPSENHLHAHRTGLNNTPRGRKSWNYGKKHSKATRAKMSAAKIGRKHPKFKGYYITPAGKFDSSGSASEANNVGRKTVLHRCKSSTFKDKRWSFQPV